MKKVYKILKRTLGLFIAIFISWLFISRLFEKKLDKQHRTDLTYMELPDTVKYYYLKSIEPEITITKGDTLRVYGPKYEIICLDPNIGPCKYEVKWHWLVSSWVDKEIFRIGSEVLTLDFNGNTINGPYVLYQKELYFRVTRNVSSKEDVEHAKYGKFDLKGVLE